MARKMRIKRPVVAVPQYLDEAAQFLSLIGQEQRKIEKIQTALKKIQTALNEKIEELKAKAMTEIKPLDEKISELFEGLFIFAQSNRDELTEGGKRKTVEMPTGYIAWRMTPPAVSIANIKKVLIRLKELGLQRFIRPKEEINKEAMLKEPKIAKTIKGVSVNQHEEFIVKPSELEIEIVSDGKKLKKVIL